MGVNCAQTWKDLDYLGLWESSGGELSATLLKVATFSHEGGMTFGQTCHKGNEPIVWFVSAYHDLQNAFSSPASPISSELGISFVQCVDCSHSPSSWGACYSARALLFSFFHISSFHPHLAVTFLCLYFRVDFLTSFSVIVWTRLVSLSWLVYALARWKNEGRVQGRIVCRRRVRKMTPVYLKPRRWNLLGLPHRKRRTLREMELSRSIIRLLLRARLPQTSFLPLGCGMKI